MCYTREVKFVPYGTEEEYDSFKNDFINKSSNCNDVDWRNESYPVHERLHCYLYSGQIYGQATQMLTKWIFTNIMNHGQRGFDCVMKGFETTKSGFCDFTYDTDYCIRQTAANSSIYLSCVAICPGYATSDYNDTNCPLYGTRYCDEYGRWETTSDYRACEQVDRTSAYFNQTLFNEYSHENASEQTEYDDQFARIMHHIIIWPLVGSLLCLITAFILFLNRRLQCIRVFIHQNLIVAWILKYLFTLLLAWIYYTMDKGTIEEGIEENNPTPNILDSPALQKSFRILETFFYLVGSTWFFIEAIFLQYQISMNVFGAEHTLRMRHLLVVGWGIPVLLTIPWIILIDRRYQLKHAELREKFFQSQLHGTDYNKFLYRKESWQSINNFEEHYMIAAPQLVMLFLNTVILLNIVRIIISKVRVTASDDYEVFKKSFKATFSLLPLFGLGIIIGIFSFDDAKFSTAGHVQTIFTILMQNCQGIFISVIYCFMNKEVQRRLRQKFQHIASRHSSAFYSRATDISNFSGISESLSARWTKTIKRVSERSRTSNMTDHELSTSRVDSLLHSADSYSNLDSTSI